MHLETNVHDGAELNTLGLRMLALNHDAIGIRYGEQQEIGAYVFRAEPMVTPMQAYKSLCCWLYQCSEGSLPETSELYRSFEELKNTLANSLCSTLPPSTRRNGRKPLAAEHRARFPNLARY